MKHADSVVPASDVPAPFGPTTVIPSTTVPRQTQRTATGRPTPPRLGGPDGLLAPLVQQFVTSTLDIELREHLGYDRHDAAGWGTGNSRNGVSPKVVTTDIGDLEIRVPRDRCGSFTPMLVPKRLRHLPHLGATVLLLHSSGMPPRLALERIGALYRCAGSRPEPHLPELVLRAALRDAADRRSRGLPAAERMMVDKLQVASPFGLIIVYAAVGRSSAGQYDIHGLWATSAAAAANPAPESLVGAHRRVWEAPARMHTHQSADVLALVHRAWPRATPVTDIHRQLGNPFRAEWQRVFPTAARVDQRRYAVYTKPRVAS
jgi:putative transposase